MCGYASLCVLADSVHASVCVQRHVWVRVFALDGPRLPAGAPAVPMRPSGDTSRLPRPASLDSLRGLPAWTASFATGECCPMLLARACPHPTPPLPNPPPLRGLRSEDSTPRVPRIAASAPHGPPFGRCLPLEAFCSPRGFTEVTWWPLTPQVASMAPDSLRAVIFYSSTGEEEEVGGQQGHMVGVHAHRGTCSRVQPVWHCAPWHALLWGARPPEALPVQAQWLSHVRHACTCRYTNTHAHMHTQHTHTHERMRTQARTHAWTSLARTTCARR